MSHRPAPDQAARDRALHDLDTNLLVEAGAGSGKTTLMAGRVVAMLAAGREPSRIAAVTFTKKAAAELRERVQVALEEAGRDAAVTNELFIGTIHGFCARILRDRPIEAGLDPRFRELDEDESRALAREWWDAWLERLHVEGDVMLARVRGLGVEPRALADAFGTFVAYPDADFSAPEVPVPDLAPLRRALESLIDEGRALLPSAEPAAGWDALQLAIQRLRFERQARDWMRPHEFFEGLALLPAKPAITQIRWVLSPESAKADKAAAKAFSEKVAAWRGGPAADALTRWREHRYAPVATLLRRAADEFASHRLNTGRLSFEDLLLHAADLLRRDPDARRALGERWRHLLVDEFQDTDPIQAEVIFLLGSEPDGGQPDWTTATLRPGTLFVVGDPKQSIYRFRRADIETYSTARTTIERQGAVLRLTANFRSVSAIATFVNAHFGGDRGAFPPTATPVQAAFAPLEPVTEEREDDPRGGVARYEIGAAHGEGGKEVVIERDAAAVASWIKSQIDAGTARASDVLILARTKAPLSPHARALAERDIPVSVSGAAVPLEAELHELRLLLELLQDPANPVLVAAVLEGRLFGMSPADLWAARRAGLAFTVARPPALEGADERAVRVAQALACVHAWLERARTDTPDVLLARVLDETGLLAYTAADDLGDVRAGLLVRLLEDIQSATLDPELAGNAALGTLARLLDGEIPDAPLLPGRTDAVRVMNLHKAKGLEGELVILAAPLQAKARAPRVAVSRASGRARGGVLVTVPNGFQFTVIAQPPGWDAMQAAEAAFAKAEGDRLLYVAATRARSRLVVGEFVKELKGSVGKPDDREWSAFAPTLDAINADDARVAPAPALGRALLPEQATDIQARAQEAERRRQAASQPTWRHTTVTASAKAEANLRQSLDVTVGAAQRPGAAWGRAIHRLLEEAGVGAGFVLERAAARIAGDEGIADRADALVTLARQAFAGEAWQSLHASPERRQEWAVAGWIEENGVPTYVEGVIDAAYRTAEGWHIIDWKTDDVTPEAWAQRVGAYERQVRAYADLLQRATRQRVTTSIERLVLRA